MRFVFYTGLLTLLAVPALASGDYTTPEYSGPSARIDSGGMGGTEPMVTRSAPIGPSPSDRGFENRIERRGEKIGGEMNRRRDESIRNNEHHILKNNGIKMNE
ncbi:MAG TPA: hypothetical protein VFS88_06675 [Micavibrio sp.]|nr:hypothetical protein [Micavibrio sp.]